MDILIPGSELLNNMRTDLRVVFHRKGQLSLACGATLPVRTIDISPGGVGLICPHPIQEKQICTLALDTIVPDMPDLLLRGSTTYCILSGTRGFRVGIKFNGTDSVMLGYVKKLVDKMKIL